MGRDRLSCVFSPENFLVATPMGLIRKCSNGSVSNGPIIKPDSISFLISSSTTSGSARADWRLSQMIFWVGWHSTPCLKPCLRPDNRSFVKLTSGWWDNSSARQELTGAFCTFIYRFQNSDMTANGRGQMLWNLSRDRGERRLYILASSCTDWLITWTCTSRILLNKTSLRTELCFGCKCLLKGVISKYCMLTGVNEWECTAHTVWISEHQ